jgi:hypothetical protein
MSGKTAAIFKAVAALGNRKPWRRADVGAAIRPGDLQQIAWQAYENKPKAAIGDLELARATDTLKIYKKRGTNKYVVGVRGTATGKDAIADAALSVGLLKYSKRYKQDREALRQFVKEHPDADIETAGHSLGGAVARQLGRDVANIKTGTAYNSAIGLDELLSPSKLGSVKQKRYSTRNDFLRLLSKPFLKKEHQAQVVDSGAEGINPLTAHKLSNFDATGSGV